MKIRLLLTLAGLAIGYAVPAFTQEKDTVDPQIRQQLVALFKKFDEASNKADATALAALFTQDAVEVAPEGPVYGRQALEKKYSDMFQKWHPTDHLNTIERVYMLGKDTCVINKWSAGGLKGYVTTINVREGDNWLFRIATVNLAPAPAAAPSQQTNAPDPQLREKLVAAIKKHTDALDKNDAAAVAANFTEDGILVTPGGPISGREAIEKHYADDFKQGFHSSNNIATPDDDSPHLGKDSNQMWATGKWTATVQGKDWGPSEATGYWSVIREGPDWKIRMLAFNVTPAPAK